MKLLSYYYSFFSSLYYLNLTLTPSHLYSPLQPINELFSTKTQAGEGIQG
jgi:hypothetical protein